MSEQPRPGPSAWLVIAAGWAVMGVVVAGVLRESDASHPRSWAAWVIGAALIHDLVVLPLVLLVGVGLGRLMQPSWRGPVRAALVVAAVLTLATWPVVRRYGARADNPTVLPLPAGRNLLIILAVLALSAGVAGLIRSRRLASPPSGERGTR